MVNGFHIGIVVQNNDPLKSGRIKVFVPHVSATIYTNWNSLTANKDFIELGSNKNESISNVIDTAKDILPWAVPASPIIGESGSTYYNAYDNITGNGDGEEGREGVDEYGDKPSKIFENSPLSDAYMNNFVPISYSSLPKGSFSIPKVGSHVWVFYHNNDIMYPVYFAMAYGGDISKMYSDDTYPDKFENYSRRDADEYDNIYKNKWVLNQRGATIEINNSDNQESITITHYSGSFKQILKDIVKEFIQKDEIRLVNNDQFETINNNRDQTIKNINTEYVGLSSNRTVDGDDVETISGERKLTVSNGEKIVISQNTDKTVGGDYVLTISGDKNVDVSGGYILHAGSDGITLETGGNVSIRGANITLDGDVEVTGDFEVGGDTTLLNTAINGTPQVGD
jgi:hypothetical protein